VLEEDAERGVRRAATLEKADREVQVDVGAGGKLAGVDRVVSGPLELLGPPELDALGLGLDVDIELSS
jgi:hypothetical protein